MFCTHDYFNWGLLMDSSEIVDAYLLSIRVPQELLSSEFFSIQMVLDSRTNWKQVWISGSKPNISCKAGFKWLTYVFIHCYIILIIWTRNMKDMSVTVNVKNKDEINPADMLLSAELVIYFLWISDVSHCVNTTLEQYILFRLRTATTAI